MKATEVEKFYTSHFSDSSAGIQKQAFLKLYDKYSPLLYGLICKEIENEKLACEILQKAFVKIWAESLEENFSTQNPIARVVSVTYKTALNDFGISLSVTAKKPLAKIIYFQL